MAHETAFSQSKKVISMETLLNEMIDREAVARFPQTDFRLKQASSYSRLSTNAEDTVTWFSNKDFNSNETDHNFIRIEERDGQKEWVLMDHEGAGTIVRTWMPWATDSKPETNNRIRIYLDGANKPVIEGNMLGLLDGTGLFPYPFAHQSLRSAVSFFPITYAKSCKITVTECPFFYQFTYREYPKGTHVKTFTMADYHAAKKQIETTGYTLLHPDIMALGKKNSFTGMIAPKATQSITLPKGQAAIKTLSVKLANDATPEITRKVVIKITFDDHETVWCPIGDFFGCGIGLNPVQGWYSSVTEDGTMTCRWVMPYKKTAKIALLNLSHEPIDVCLSATVGKWQWDAASMYFNAAWHGQYPVATRPYSDWNYVTLKGRGVYVGDALTVMNPVEKWWGEGDEKIRVDDEKFPSIFGTGTEDYYGYSWGGKSTGFYEHPFHAQPFSHKYNKLNPKTTNEKNTLGFSTETRTRSLDVMPFGKSLHFDMEIWSWTDCEMGYGVGLYWYGDATTTSNRIPDEKEVLNVPQVPEK